MIDFDSCERKYGDEDNGVSFVEMSTIFVTLDDVFFATDIIWQNSDDMFQMCVVYQDQFPTQDPNQLILVFELSMHTIVSYVNWNCPSYLFSSY